MDLMIDLYVMMMVSLCCPHVLPASAFSMLRRDFVLFMIDLACWPNVKWVSRVTPRTLGALFRGSWMLSMLMFGVMCDWWVSGVNSVTVHLGTERWRL